MIVNEESSLTIVNEGLSLSYMQEKVVGELNFLIFSLKLLNDKYRCSSGQNFLSPPFFIIANISDR